MISTSSTNYGDNDDNATYEHTNVPIVVCIEEVIIAIMTKEENDGCISNENSRRKTMCAVCGQ